MKSNWRVFGVPSTFQAHTVWLSFCIGNPSLYTMSLEMKHFVTPLSINAFTPMILPSCFQIKMGRQIELDLDLEINTGAIVKKEGSVGPSPPFKKTHDDQGEKHGA